MSTLVNNTKYRNITLTVQKRVNNVITETNVYNLLAAFTGYALITEEQLATLTDAQYFARRDAFYAHVESLVTGFNRTMVINNSNGTDAVTCPLPGVIPTPITVNTFSGSMQPLSGGTLDDHLVWEITLSAVATRDITYSFDVLLKDLNGNPIRTESVYGIVRSGQTTHQSLDDGLAIYIPEVYQVGVGPDIIVETITASLTTDL